jgi:hypothetical protein
LLKEVVKGKNGLKGRIYLTGETPRNHTRNKYWHIVGGGKLFLGVKEKYGFSLNVCWHQFLSGEKLHIREIQLVSCVQQLVPAPREAGAANRSTQFCYSHRQLINVMEIQSYDAGAVLNNMFEYNFSTFYVKHFNFYSANRRKNI